MRIITMIMFNVCLSTTFQSKPVALFEKYLDERLRTEVA